MHSRHSVLPFPPTPGVLLPSWISDVQHVPRRILLPGWQLFNYVLRCGLLLSNGIVVALQLLQRQIFGSK